MTRVIKYNTLTGVAEMQELTSEEITEHNRKRQEELFAETMEALPPELFGFDRNDVRLAFDLGMSIWPKVHAIINDFSKLIPVGPQWLDLCMFAAITAFKEIIAQASAEMEAMAVMLAGGTALGGFTDDQIREGMAEMGLPPESFDQILNVLRGGSVQ